MAAIVEEIKNIVAGPSMAGRSIETRHLKNSNDLKFKVLHHFAKPMPVQNQTNNPIELCESYFERDVFSKLKAMQIHPSDSKARVNVFTEHRVYNFNTPGLEI